MSRGGEEGRDYLFICYLLVPGTWWRIEFDLDVDLDLDLMD